MTISIADLLRTADVISAEQLQAALEEQKRSGGTLAHVLVALGYVTGDGIATLVSRLYGVPLIDLDHHEIAPAVIAMVPTETARKYKVLPTSLNERVLTIAMADPRNVLAMDDIAFMTGCRVKQVVASEPALEAAIERYHGSARSLELRRSDRSALDELPAIPADPPLDEATAQTIEQASAECLQSRTRAVWWLVAANVAIFGLELLWGGGSGWGGGSSPFTLYRMGAGLGRAALAHEPWRVLSAAFLHINVVHLALNMWALVVFGWMLEAMLGARRFIVLYGLSALGGGLASSLVHPRILAAGASGAVWGLMTAQIAVLVRLKRLHGPEAMPLPMKTLLKPLVINLLFSLLPFIDLSAHLGGGAVGAALIFSGLVWGPRPAAAWRPAAWAASLAMAGCVVLALARGRPWELRSPPPLVHHALADALVEVPVPVGLNETPGDEQNVTVYGNRYRDPLVLYCAAGRLDAPCSDPEARACLSQAARGLGAGSLEQGWSWDQRPHLIQLGSRLAVFASIRSQGGLTQLTWMMMEGLGWLRLDVVQQRGAPASWSQLPGQIAHGVAFNPAAE